MFDIVFPTRWICSMNCNLQFGIYNKWNISLPVWKSHNNTLIEYQPRVENSEIDWSAEGIHDTWTYVCYSKWTTFVEGNHAVASPAQKSGGVQKCLYAGEQIKSQHGTTTTSISTKTVQQFCSDLNKGRNFSGGVRAHPFYPGASPLKVL